MYPPRFTRVPKSRLKGLLMGSGLIHTVAGAAIVLAAWLAPAPIPLADLMMVELTSLSADATGSKEAEPEPTPAPQPEPEPEPEPTPEPEPEPAPEPPPPPPPDNPLWDQLDQAVTQTAPDTGVSVAEQFNKLAKEAPKPPPKPEPAPPPSDLGEWWKKQAKQAPQPTPEPEPTSPPKAPAVAPSLSDRWARLKKKKDDSTPPSTDDKKELSRFWNKLNKNPKARQGKAQSATATVRYLGQVERRITSKWSPPRLSESITQLMVVVAFSVHSHGGVSQLRVVRSSGVDVFDQAAARAVLLSAPMPPFPKEMTTPEEEIRFTFTLAPELLG